MNHHRRPALQSLSDLQECVRASPKLHIIGRGSKSALHQAAADCTIADLSALSGITEYLADEYTLTAKAGTPVQTIQTELRAKGQYLPFDPLFPARASIGGTVASNLAGPRRFRYGGVRDFILGAQIVDGQGRAFRVGGKVVKNAAGFDLSKFLVGSLGRFAAITALTFKVFPDAPHSTSLQLRYRTLADLLAALFFINQSIYELDALDFAPQGESWLLLVRLTGFEAALPQKVDRLVSALHSHSSLLESTERHDDAALWNPLAQLSQGWLVKVVLSPKQIPPLDARIPDMQRRYSVGGGIAWIAAQQAEQFDRLRAILQQQGLAGLCIRGTAASPLIGTARGNVENVLAARVRQVLDPQHKFV